MLLHADPENEEATDARAESELLKLIFGFRFSQVIYAATRLGIADLLEDGPQRSAQLAAATGADVHALTRLLHALTHLGVVAEVEPGVFGLASLGRPLRANAARSVRALTLSSCDEASWRSWGGLLHSVGTGQPAFQHIFGMTTFEYLAEHPEVSAIYHEASARDTSMAFSPEVLARLDCSRFHTVVDVGGGRGALLSGLLRANPAVRGILFDTPAGLAGVGATDRCQVVSGDFLESVPEGGDAYILKYILLDWSDADAARILANCRRVMPANGVLIVIELVLPDELGSSERYTTTGDLGLLVTTGGRERTRDEFAALLKSAGFELSSITALTEDNDVKAIEAVPT
jgi:hypothetical protein